MACMVNHRADVWWERRQQSKIDRTTPDTKCYNSIFWQNYTLLEQKGIVSSIIDEKIKFKKT